MMLTGLRNNNLQGYLAALGVVKLIPKAQLGWDKVTGCAVLEGVEDPVKELGEMLKLKDPYARLMWLTAKSEDDNELVRLNKEKKNKELGEDELKAINAKIKTIKDRPSTDEFRERQAANAPKDWGSPDDLFWMQGLWTPGGEPNNLNLMGKGNNPEGFFGSLAKSRSNIKDKQAADKLNEALFGPWRHEDNVGAMNWEFESLGYGPRHQGKKQPADTNKRSVAAAQWLAGEGLPVVGCVVGKEVRLPLWYRPEPLRLVMERLKHRMGETYILAVKDSLPVSKGLPYWVVRTLSDAKKQGGSRKKSLRIYKDLHNGCELWMI